jgi:hypothetical protein
MEDLSSTIATQEHDDFPKRLVFNEQCPADWIRKTGRIFSFFLSMALRTCYLI